MSVLTRWTWLIVLLSGLAALTGCSPEEPAPAEAERVYLLERVDDAAVVQLYADNFESKSLEEKQLIWHLVQAAIAGRDIFYDQKSPYGLEMREVVEAVIRHPAGVPPETLEEVTRYAKLFWINSGPYNNLTARKFLLELEPSDFGAAVAQAEANGAQLPLGPGETRDDLLARLGPMFFDPAYAPSVTTKTPPAGQDILTASANNLYSGVSMADLDGFEERYPLNSRLVKRDGKLVEEVYRIDGRYGPQIREIVGHLTAARDLAPAPTAAALDALIAWYRTGEPADRRAYDIAWVEDAHAAIDTINGFTEVYLDARGVKGAWEGLVYYVDEARTEAIGRLAAEAQWFEDHMPWLPEYRKADVTGITANAIEAIVETGDVGPMTPIGINLPNDQSVREAHGSKSVSLANVIDAYARAESPELRVEFSWSPEEAERAARWSAIAGEITTNMHEVIGHASGRVADRLNGRPEVFIGEYFSALEEGRADLVGLYFIADPKIVELGLVEAADHDELVQAEYEAYTRNALVQLRRVREGTQIEEDHMRNRQMIVHWLMANTRAVETRVRDGRTYYVMVDRNAFREGVGRLLAEVQRIKAEGDREAARLLFDTYGIHFDPALRDEVVRRVEAVGVPSYTGFVMPRLEVVTAEDGSIEDVGISYPRDLTRQMLEYADMTRASRQAFMAAEAERRVGR